jgi:hypothetical protein
MCATVVAVAAMVVDVLVRCAADLLLFAKVIVADSPWFQPPPDDMRCFLVIGMFSVFKD